MDSLPSASEASFLLVENSLPKKGKSVQTKLQISSIDSRFGLKILTALDCKSLTELVLKSSGWVRFIHPIDGLRSESLDGLSGKWNQNTQCSLFSSTSLGLLNLGLLITKSIWENVESFFFCFLCFSSSKWTCWKTKESSLHPWEGQNIWLPCHCTTAESCVSDTQLLPVSVSPFLLCVTLYSGRQVEVPFIPE